MEKTRHEIQREERKQQIVDVALELFGKNGFHGVSVNVIAKACGISKGLMYNYFDSKEDLLVFILTDYAQKISVHLKGSGDGVMTPPEFEHFVRTTYLLVKQNPKYYKLIFSLSFQESVAPKLAALANDLVPFNYDILRTYFASLGRLDPDVEVLMFSSVIKGLLLQVVMIFDLPDLIPVYQQKFDAVVDRLIADYTV